MPRTVLRLAFSALLLLSVPLAHADDFQQVREWLERLAASMQDLSYQGTFVYVRGEEVDTLRVTHVVDAAGTRERMYAISGPQREVIRDAEGVRCVLGESAPALQDSLVAGNIFPEFSGAALRGADQVYQFRLGTRARVAGQPAQRIMIFPRDEYRYGYDLWLEVDSGMLLRWVLYDTRRAPLAKLEFTEIVIGAEVDASELQSTLPSQSFVKMANAIPPAQPADADPAVLSPDGIPPGFRLAARNLQPLADGAAAGPGDVLEFEHRIYSDGLASVSVYMERKPALEQLQPGLSKLGTTNAWSVRRDDFHVTVIGEVPAATVKRFGTAFAAR